MALNAKHRKSKRRALRRAVRGGISRLRKQVRPETQSAAESSASPAAPGILRPDAASWRLPDGLAEAGESDSQEGAWSWMPGAVVITITALALLFISVIAWFVSRMPAPR
ncbi:MAG: hypothetical protein ACKVX9_03515 [Blastocatellia bacterium]